MAKNPTRAAPAKVTRIVCTSVSRVRGSIMDELFRIRDHTCTQGAGTPVKGALLYSAGWFVLWLEGPEAAVEAARQRAAANPRNEHQKVLHRSVGPASLAEVATVVMAQGAETAASFWERIQRLSAQGGAALDPSAIWQSLSAPCVAPPGVGIPVEPSRHVALVAAEDNGPLHLLRNLGDRCGSTLVYQRFADSRVRSSDVGVAYVDVPAGSDVVRVQLLSRRALGHQLVRASLGGLESLVLLLGQRPSAAVELAANVAACVESLPVRPVLYLSGGSEELAAPVRQLLRRKSSADGDAGIGWLDESQLAEFIAGSDAMAREHARRLAA